jgi:hypothetical protein
MAVVCATAAMIAFQPGAVQAADDAVNPHWNRDGCEVCHEEAAPVRGAVNLKAADAEALCETCHGSRGGAVLCRHSSDIPSGSLTIAESLQSSLKDGRVVCTTCHDIVHQCERPKPHFSLQNPGFLRDRTSHHTEDYCFKCHEDSGYAALNPHTGVAGDPPKATCPLCHVSVPESEGKSALRVSFNMEYDLNEACRGCHDVRPHPIGMSFGAPAEGWVHLVRPSIDVFGKIERWQAATGTNMPLSPNNGEIYCATCHDPHEFEGGPAAQQPEHRLRAVDICQACHEK